MAKRRPGSFSGEAQIEPAPAADALRRAPVEDLIRPRVRGAPRDGARSYRRGSAATGEREAEVALWSVSVGDAIPPL